MKTYLKRVFLSYDPTAIYPGWGLDAVLGAGTPYVGFDESEFASRSAEVAAALRKSPISLGLYGGFINMSWSYASPTMVTLSLNLRGADDSVVGNAQFNNLVRQSQYILTQMVAADRHDELQAATERFGELG